ncbi:hypothetical protein [Sphingopyxis sp.]|uniref:hypothetical protein n=1 Tax=Sphingopyxis sp. TaxID=1908224 RepID=UPI001DA36C7E|nr:hypothetical protein [Sphingopyxis sp.]MBW8294743.1 hypothetical protein [Sphingopyxis sp.]
MNTDPAATIAKLFDDLSLTKENSQVESLQGEISRIDAALAIADDQIRGVERSLQDAGALAGRHMADALLAHRTPSDLGPSETELRERQTDLQAGVDELNGRRVELVKSIEALQSSAIRSAQAKAEIAASAIYSRVQAAAEVIVGAYASLSVLSEETGVGKAELRKARTATKALIGHDHVLPHRVAVDVPPEIAGALRVLERKGAALPISFRKSVRF